MSDETEVRAASAQFYEALNRVVNGDAGPMSDIWHHGPDATTAHPMGDWAHGWEQIQVTWEELASMITDGSIATRGLTIQVYGDVACTTGIEDCAVVIGGRPARFSVNVTNLFHRRDGVWKIVHHHADKAPSAEKVIDELLG